MEKPDIFFTAPVRQFADAQARIAARRYPAVLSVEAPFSQRSPSRCTDSVDVRARARWTDGRGTTDKEESQLSLTKPVVSFQAPLIGGGGGGTTRGARFAGAAPTIPV
jgi:hypothetical protein